MLARLYIKNYAIIDEVSLDFSDGLTIITGETGAGKSILLGALELILGKRADLKSLKKTDAKCIIEATFNIGKYDLSDFFDSEDLDFSEQTIVRRELSPSGKSRAFINDTPAKLSTLQALCDSLIDMHRQFATQDINNVSFQLRMLDALADNSSSLKAYRLKFVSYSNKVKQLNLLKQQSASSDQALDFIKFQLNEFDEVNIQSGEMTQLEKERTTIENSESIKDAFEQAEQVLTTGEGNIVDQLQDLVNAFSPIANTNEEIKGIYTKLNSTLLELEDISSEMRKGGFEGALEEGRLVEINSRLDKIYRLLNKHQKQSEDDLLQFHQELKQQISGFDNLSHDIERLTTEIEDLAQKLTKEAQKLTKSRQKVIKPFVAEVHDTLSRMNMANAKLQINITPLTKLSNTGLDDIQFLFSTNPGSPFLPVKDVASGGELSRLTLAVKSKVADAIPLPTLVYDEIDTGISGGTAMQMGQILDNLSDNHQVIVITHTPQVAVKADKHLYVSKATDGKRTTTQIVSLKENERVTAIAKMLSGDPPSAAAIENAKQLLSE